METLVKQTAVQNPTTSQEVVLNNIPKSTVSAKQQAVNLLAKLSEERQTWETTVYRTSNEMLYSILQSCYTAEFGMRGGETEAKERRDGLKAFASKLGFTFKDSTPTMNRIVQCVFGAVKRSRITTYSLVLREAKKQNIAVSDIPKFITENGGLQEIRLSKSDKYVSPKQKVEKASGTIASKTLATVSSQTLSQIVDVEKVGELCVLLATQNADSTFTVKAVSHGKTAVNATLVAVYGMSVSEINETARQTEAANDSNVTSDIVNQIVNKSV